MDGDREGAVAVTSPTECASGPVDALGGTRSDGPLRARGALVRVRRGRGHRRGSDAAVRVPRVSPTHPGHAQRRRAPAGVSRGLSGTASASAVARRARDISRRRSAAAVLRRPARGGGPRNGLRSRHARRQPCADVLHASDRAGRAERGTGSRYRDGARRPRMAGRVLDAIDRRTRRLASLGPVSVMLMRRRSVVAWIGGSALLFAAAALLLPFVGPSTLDWGRVWQRQDPDWSILTNLRLSRTLLGLFAGGALALAGSLFQSMLRDALATPYTLGVSTGASLGAVLAIAFDWHVVAGVVGVWAGALAGAGVILFVVMGAATRG